MRNGRHSWRNNPIGQYDEANETCGFLNNYGDAEKEKRRTINTNSVSLIISPNSDMEFSTVRPYHGCTYTSLFRVIFMFQI